MKISYRTTPNMGTIISGHNKKIQSNSNKTASNDTPTCNCQRPAECPLDGKCLQEAVVYKATVTTSTTTKTYIGSTEQTFKQRWYGHKSDLTHAENKNKTTLAAYVWKCKEKGETPSIKWSIIKKCRKYRCGTRVCDICLSEKLYILTAKQPLINKRSELMGRCPHRRKWRLQQVSTQ